MWHTEGHLIWSSLKNLSSLNSQTSQCLQIGQHQDTAAGPKTRPSGAFHKSINSSCAHIRNGERVHITPAWRHHALLCLTLCKNNLLATAELAPTTEAHI